MTKPRRKIRLETNKEVINFVSEMNKQDHHIAYFIEIPTAHIE